MPKVKIIEPGEIVTPPTPLPVPSPTYETEGGERYTAQGEVITAPRNRYTGDTHAEIPEYEGSYFVTENGTIPCGGYEMISDLVVNVEPKGLTQITITENGTYKPTEYDGYSQVVVAIPSYNGSYSVSANGTLSTKDKLMTDDLVVNVQPNLTTLTATENKTYTPTAPVQGFSSVTVNVPVGGNTLKTLLDSTKSCYYLFYSYRRDDIANLIQPNDTSEVTEFGRMFNGCTSMTTAPNLNTSKGTSFSWFFQNCSSLVSVPLYDTSNGINLDNFFNGCSSLKVIPALDFSKGGTLTNAFKSCSSLEQIHITGIKVSFDIHSSTLFTREALVEIITNCASVGTTQTLTIGATNLAKLTQADIDLATSKGWTIS